MKNLSVKSKQYLRDLGGFKKLSEIIGFGLMSGTSMDGIDVALVKFFQDSKTLPEVLAYETLPFQEDLKKVLRRVSIPGQGQIEDLVRAHWALGHAYANAVLEVADRQKIDLQSVQFIACHGQTIRHFPEAKFIGSLPSHGTFQIGEPAVIASKTGILTLADFRAADMALGGQGAPLVPFFDFKFFVHPEEDRIFLNIGGIANLTFLPASARPNQVYALDCGPGNMVIDQLALRFFHQPFDPDGRLAAEGRVHEKLLHWLLTHPYLKRSLPKSAGREDFGEAFVDQLCEKSQELSVCHKDILATTTYFTARVIHDSIREIGKKPELIIYVSGGGRHNKTLMRHLQQLLYPGLVKNFDETGLPGDAKEAVCFAFLGLMLLKGEPASLPGITGAKKAALLGKICLPS